MSKDKLKKEAKKSIATLSYKDSYTDAVASKWESKGGYDAYVKAAKAYNQKKYGTTEPTARAKKEGISKEELSKKNTERKTEAKNVSDKISKEVKQQADKQSEQRSLKREVKPVKEVKVETKEEKAKRKIKAGDKKAGELAGLEGKAKRKANKAGKAQMKADKAKKKTEDALEKVKERQKEGKNVEAAQAKTARLNEKRKRKEKKAGKKMEKAKESMATYKKDAAYMKDDAAYMMKNNMDGGEKNEENPAAAAEQLKGLSAGMMRENPIGYFKHKIKYNNSSKDIAIRVAADEKDKAHSSKAGKKRLDKDISSMISHASMAHKHGAMKGDQSASHVDYANYKGTDKGYHGKTGASHGDQSASRADYMKKKKGGSILSKHFKS